MFPDHPRFRQLSFLGCGSFGVVFRVYDEELEIEVALKALSQNSADPYTLKREFRLVADIRHRNLGELFELFVPERWQPFFTMELLSGTPLNHYLRQLLPAAQARAHSAPGAASDTLLDLVRQFVQGLQALHAAGIVHCDIKPSNVLVDHHGRLVLLDFGLAQYTAPASPLANTPTGGTWAYIAPELALGSRASPASDWYSAAALLYEVATGVIPFLGSPIKIFQQKRQWEQTGAVSPIVALPPELWRLVRASLDHDPNHRPTDSDWLACLHDKRAASVGDPTVPWPSPRLAFVGRETELAKLEAAFWRVLQGYPALAHLSGPPGIGKTRLAEHFVEGLQRSQPVHLLRGRCHPAEDVPYNAFDSVVDQLCCLLETQAVEQRPILSPRQWEDLATLFPVLRGAQANKDPTPLATTAQGTVAPAPRELRERAFAALREVFRFLARSQPLIVWIDDLQWADQDSRALLRSVFLAREAPPCFLLLTHRDSEDLDALFSSSGEVALDNASRPWCEHVVLQPLSRDEARQLANRCQHAATGRDPGDLNLLIGEGAGNPLLLVQLVKHREASRTGPMAGSNAELTNIVCERLLALPLPARRMVEAAAVAGHPVAREDLLEIAGVGEKGRLALRQAVDALLLQVAPGANRSQMDVFHQRIAQGVLASVPASSRTAYHAFWLRCCLAWADKDPERLYFHALGAGQTPVAAEYAVLAAHRAEEQLAFARAATLYDEALRLRSWGPETTLDLELRQAEALVSAGRGAEAAPLFAAASRRATAEAALALRTRAAEQYLLAGFLAEGTALLREVLKSARLPDPKSATAAFIRTIGRVLRFRLPRLPRRRRDETSRTRLRLEMQAAEAAPKGFAVVDPVRALYFALRRLSAATALEDEKQITLARCTTGATLLPVRGPFQQWARRLLSQGVSHQRVDPDPYVQAVIAQSSAQSFMLDCRWKEMRDACERSLALLQQQDKRSHWEEAVAMMAKLRAEEALGEIGAVRQQSQQWLERASALGDRYGACVAWEYFGWASLLSGNLATARHAVRRARELWVSPSFQMQQFYASRLGAYIALATGDAELAWQEGKTAWLQARAAGMLRHALLALDADLLLLRTCLAHQHSLRRSSAQLPRWVERRKAALLRTQRADALGFGLLLEAASAEIRADSACVVNTLVAAADRFQASGMRLAHAVAQHELGRRSVGAAGMEMLHCARTYLERQGLPQPEIVTHILAPGLHAPPLCR